MTLDPEPYTVEVQPCILSISLDCSVDTAWGAAQKYCYDPRQVQEVSYHVLT